MDCHPLWDITTLLINVKLWVMDEISFAWIEKHKIVGGALEKNLQCIAHANH